MRRVVDSSARTLLVAFASVAAAFTLSTAVVERSDVAIRRAAQEIAGNAAPSIEQLSRLRADLRHVTLLVDGDLDAALEGRPRFERARIEAARATLDRDWARFRAVPSFQREIELIRAAETARNELSRAVAQVEILTEAGARSAARATLEDQLRPAADRLDAAVLRLIDFSAARGGALAGAIGRLGRESLVHAIVLDTICVLLTIATVFLVWRVLRRYTALLERRAEELELFAGRVAHDLMGPLSPASLALSLIARGGASTERVQRAVEAGQTGIKRARVIADGLLAFARAGARPEAGARADVAEVVTAAVDEISDAIAEHGISLRTEVASAGAVACNPGVLASVVSNLLGNAIKYAGDVPSPRIVVRARRREDRLGARRVLIEVEDNGPGLPADLGDQIFEPYVRGADTHKPGIGLGLATVKKIAQALGGQVQVRSTPGAGATFVVDLPAVQAVARGRDLSVCRPELRGSSSR
jgi:signal transduction histidine kinase